MDKAIPAEEQGQERAADREISMALFGLQRMGDNPPPARDREESREALSRDSPHRFRMSPELRRVLVYLTSLMQYHDGPFEAKRLSFAVCGLASMTHDSPEVLGLITQLANKTVGAWGTISGHELSMCLHGMRSLQSESRPVRELVAGLVPIVRACPVMEAYDIASAFNGLQGMRDSAKEVCSLAGAMADLLSRSKISLRSPAVAADVIYGMQGLSNSNLECRRLFAQIPDLIENVDLGVDSHAAAAYLYGLKSCSSKHSETLDVVRAVTRQLKRFRGTFASIHVASALYGMQGLSSDSEEVKELLTTITPLVGNATGTFNPKGLSMAINGLQVIAPTHPTTFGFYFTVSTSRYTRRACPRQCRKLGRLLRS